MRWLHSSLKIQKQVSLPGTLLTMQDYKNYIAYIKYIYALIYKMIVCKYAFNVGNG